MGCLRLENIEKPTLLKVLNGGKIRFENSCEKVYRYSFNGMESDDEIKGKKNSYTTEFRQYDPRIGRWLTTDPLDFVEAGWTPYRFGFDNPMNFTDKTGLYETKREAKKAKKLAEKDGYKTGSIYGKKGSYTFNGTKDDEWSAFNKKYGDHEYKLTQNQVEYYNRFLPKNQQKSTGWSLLGMFMETDYYFSAEEYKKLTSGFETYMYNQNSLPVGQRASAQGGCDPCDGFWQSFIGLGVGGTTQASGRVFWSGGEVAKDAAVQYAKSSGGITLEMTTKGKILEKATEMTSFTLTKPFWKQASKSFAKGASGEVTFITTSKGPVSTSIWKTVEKPILEENLNKINTIIAP